ncbi:MAG TPA: hypothetical protein VJA21_28130 [Verrucomicrobiae bacterium]
MSPPVLSKEEIKRWLMDAGQWPNDSYDIESLKPSSIQQRREETLRSLLPTWCWSGEAGSTVLSIGCGKAYWERKLWTPFEKVYIIDPSENTRLSLSYFPIPNAEFLGTTLFDQHIYLKHTPKYGWFGASIHYLFGEFYGWEFMFKLGMMISDSIIIDAGVFDPDTRHGKVFLDGWKGEEAFEIYRRSQFSYARFLERIAGIWEVQAEWPTPWIDGRRTLVLKRSLPPVIQKAELGTLELVKTTPYWSVYRTPIGYYKESPSLPLLLSYDVVSKVMGWTDMLRWRVYDGERYCGFVTKDLGEVAPNTAAVSERMHLSLASWLIPLGLVPGDVARQNIRLCGGSPIWMDIDVRPLKHLDARVAAWIVTNAYKQYEKVPADIKGISRHIGREPQSLVRTQWRQDPSNGEAKRWQELLLKIKSLISVSTPEASTILVISKGDEDFMSLEGRRVWHFPRGQTGAYAGFHPANDEEAMSQLKEQQSLGAQYLVIPSSSYWWLTTYPGFRQMLESKHHRLFDDESCIIYRLQQQAPGR